MSEGGILFHSPEPLPHGALLKLHLLLPPGGEPIEAAVKVLRVIGARGGFEIGTQIVHMPTQDQRRFRQFLGQLKATNDKQQEDKQPRITGVLGGR